jgi:hypothetical protein
MFNPRRLAHPAFALALGALGCATGTGGAADSEQDSGGSGVSAGASAAGSSGAVSSAGSGSPSGGSGQAGAPVSSAGSSSAGAGGTQTGGSSGAPASAGSGNTGPVVAGLPFSEDFESGMIAAKSWTAVADQVPDATAAKWSVVADDTGKGAQLQSDGMERFLVGGNSAWTDQKLELRVQVVSGSPEIDIAFRYHALKEYYYLEFADKHFKLRDRSGGSSDLSPSTKPPLVVGTWYKLTLQAKGTEVSASLNDMVIVSGSFATMPIAAGGIAIGVGSGSGVVLFDDIHVTAP